MRFVRIGVAIMIGLVPAAACGTGDDETASTNPESSASSSTTPERSASNSASESRATAPRPDSTTPPTVPTPTSSRATCETVEQLQIGEQGCVEVLDGAVYLGDELFIANPPIMPYPGREWRRTDFPEHWNISILNNAPTDGEDWIIHDLIGNRIDQDTLRVTDVDERFIADLVRDPTPIDERIVAG